MKRIYSRMLAVVFGALILTVVSASATTITTGGTAVAGQGLYSSVAGAVTETFEFGKPANYKGGSVVKGNKKNIYAAPTGDTSKYLTTGIGTITIKFADPISYFGLYWGSVDQYNTVKLFDGASVETITGSEVALMGGIKADGTTSEYVNFFADPGVSWNKITLTSTQYAFESDNHAFITASPEPASMALIGLGVGLVGLGVARKRKA